jgi:hypothetical protein
VGSRAPILVESKLNARWSVDFVHDQLACGRRLRILNIVDDVTREYDVAEFVRQTLERTSRDATHWSLRSMANVAGFAPSTIHRIWRAFNLHPHRTDTFNLSTDPLFVEKVRDIAGLYPSRPARSFCASTRRARSRRWIALSRCSPRARDKSSGLFAALDTPPTRRQRSESARRDRGGIFTSPPTAKLLGESGRAPQPQSKSAAASLAPPKSWKRRSDSTSRRSTTIQNPSPGRNLPTYPHRHKTLLLQIARNRSSLNRNRTKLRIRTLGQLLA